MINRLASARANSLGGPDDAKQDAIAATLTVCQKYNLERDTDVVELCLDRNIADALIKKVRKGRKAFAEVPLEEAPEREAPAEPLSGADLALAVQRKVIRPEDFSLLKLRSEGKTYAQIGVLTNLTEKAVERRLAKAGKCLQQWASKKNQNL